MSSSSETHGPGRSAAPAPAAARRLGPASHADLVGLLGRYGVLLAFAAMIVAFGLARPETFPTIENAKNILTTAAPALILAVTLTVPLAMGDFDLSFGAMVGLAAGAAASLMALYGAGWELALLAALGFGLAAGLVNGFVIAYLGGSSFIITLAMGTILTGLEFALTKQQTIFSGVATEYTDLAQGQFLGLSNMVWVAVVIALAIWVLLDKTEAGRYMYATGGNAEAARLAGVRTRALRLTGFVIVALGASVVGILITSNSASYAPNLGTSYLLPAYAAAFLGSATLRPGQFSVLGTVIGVLFLGVIQTGLTMLNLETFVVNLVQGTILVLAVLLSRLGQRRA